MIRRKGWSGPIANIDYKKIGLKRLKKLKFRKIYWLANSNCKKSKSIFMLLIETKKNRRNN